MSKKRWIIIVSVVALTLLVGQIAVFAIDKMPDGVHGQHHEGNMASGMGNMMNGEGMESMMGNMDMGEMMSKMNTPEGTQMKEQCKTFLDTDA